MKLPETFAKQGLECVVEVVDTAICLQFSGKG